MPIVLPSLLFYVFFFAAGAGGCVTRSQLNMVLRQPDYHSENFSPL